MLNIALAIPLQNDENILNDTSAAPDLICQYIVVLIKTLDVEVNVRQ